MRRIFVLLAIVCAIATQSHAQATRYADTLINARGLPVAGANVAFCTTGLATSAAAVTANVATLTMSSNPLTAGFVSGQAITVSGFTGGDTYFNGARTIASLSATTISFALTHANAAAGTNGLVLQTGTSTQSCAPLTTVWTDVTATVATANPVTSDGLGNVGAWLNPLNYEVQVYGPTIGSTLTPVSVACTPPSTGCGTGSTPQTANTVYAGPASGPPGNAGFRSLVVADLPALTLANIGAGAAGTGNYNFSGATHLTGKTGPGYTATADGRFGYNTTDLNWHFAVNASDAIVTPLQGSTPLDQECAQFNVAGNKYTMHSYGAPCGIFLNAKTYGAVADVKTVSDASITNASTLVSSATANFTSADIGKRIWFINSGVGLQITSCASGVYDTTIAAVNSSTQAVIADVICIGGPTVNVTMTWGTDSTTALQTGVAAAVASHNCLLITSGNYMVRNQWISGFASTDTICLKGSGSSATNLYHSPNVPWGTLSNNTLYRFDTSAAVVEGLTLQFQGGIPGAFTNRNVVNMGGVTALSDDAIQNFNGNGITGNANFCWHITSDNASAVNLVADSCGGTGLAIQSNNFECISCLMTGYLDGVRIVDGGHTELIGGVFKGLGTTGNAINQTAASGDTPAGVINGVVACAGETKAAIRMTTPGAGFLSRMLLTNSSINRWSTESCGAALGLVHHGIIVEANAAGGTNTLVMNANYIEREAAGNAIDNRATLYDGGGNVVTGTEVNTGTWYTAGTTCGSVAACAAAPINNFRTIQGKVALNNASPAIATITGMNPAFTGATSYFCSLTDETARNIVMITYVSGTSFTITGPNTVVDTIDYVCSGN